MADPIAGWLAIRDVRRSGGAFVSVADGEILDAVRLLATRAGILAEPAGAAALAGLRTGLRSGLVDPRERVVVLVTGSGLKTPQFLGPEGRVVDVEDDLATVRELVGVRGPSA